MLTFWQWLSQLRLVETYYGFDPTQYNQLFDEELEKVIARTSDAKPIANPLKGMRGFGWMSYIAASVRHAGIGIIVMVKNESADIAVKLLTGTLFTGFDERVSGPMDLRFRASVGNAIRNMVEKDRNRRRLLPTVPIQQQFEPGGITPTICLPRRRVEKTTARGSSKTSGGW